MNIQVLAEEQIKLERELFQHNPKGSVVIVSVKHPQMTEHRVGVAMEVPLNVAARTLVRGTHKIANDDEVKAYREDLEERTELHRQKAFQKQVNSGQIAILQDNKLVRPDAAALKPKDK